MAGSCDYDTLLSGYMKGAELLDQLHNYKFLNRSHSQHNLLSIPHLLLSVFAQYKIVWCMDSKKAGMFPRL
jgi:hypothetical protein